MSSHGWRTLARTPVPGVHSVNANTDGTITVWHEAGAPGTEDHWRLTVILPSGRVDQIQARTQHAARAKWKWQAAL